MINSIEKFAIFIVSIALSAQADVSHLHTFNPGPNDHGHFHDEPDSFSGYPPYTGPILVSFYQKVQSIFHDIHTINMCSRRLI